MEVVGWLEVEAGSATTCGEETDSVAGGGTSFVRSVGDRGSCEADDVEVTVEVVGREGGEEVVDADGPGRDGSRNGKAGVTAALSEHEGGEKSEEEKRGS